MPMESASDVVLTTDDSSTAHPRLCSATIAEHSPSRHLLSRHVLFIDLQDELSEPQDRGADPLRDLQQ